MLWLVMAAAATTQMRLPVSVDPQVPDVTAVFTHRDFPKHVEQLGKSRVVGTRTTVRPDGTVESCSVERPSGDARLDAHTCAIIVARAKLAPARWIDGTPITGVLRLPVKWYLGDIYPTRNWDRKLKTPDLEVAVEQLPKRGLSIAEISIVLAVDERGKPVDCTEYPPPVGYVDKDRISDLIGPACQQASERIALTPPTDARGNPVRSVQSALVRFVRKKS